MPRVKELFPLVVMDVYVHLPGKAGLGTPGTPSTPSAAGAGAFQGSTGSMRRGFSAASGITVGSEAPPTPSSNASGSVSGGLLREATSRSIDTTSITGTTTGSGGNAALLAVDLQQIVGAFSCDSDKPPPNLDCGLTSWEYFHRLHQSRVSVMFPPSVNAFTEGSSASSVGSSSTKGSSSTAQGTGATNQRGNYWTTASSETGDIFFYFTNVKFCVVGVNSSHCCPQLHIFIYNAF